MKFRPEEIERFVVDPPAGPEIPPDWDRVFGRVVPLAVEVGFGSGEHLEWWASGQPDWNFVGIELPKGCLMRAARRCHRSGIGHVRLVRGDGRYLLRELFPTGALAEVRMLFPMPWPKARHAKHRVAGERFSTTLADVLAPGGRFELVTDQEWYAEEAASALAQRHGFRLEAVERNPERPFRTRYERKWLAEGRSIHRLAAVLDRPRPAPRICLPGSMLSLMLDPPPGEDALRALAGARFAEPGRVGEVKEVFWNDAGWLLRVVAADESFSQMFFLRVMTEAGSGKARLGVGEAPRPYQTGAVRFLIQSVARALAPTS